MGSLQRYLAAPSWAYLQILISHQALYYVCILELAWSQKKLFVSKIKATSCDWVSSATSMQVAIQGYMRGFPPLSYLYTYNINNADKIILKLI